MGIDGNIKEQTDEGVASCDIILVVHDLSQHYTDDHLIDSVLRILCLYPKKPAILILNKVKKSVK